MTIEFLYQTALVAVIIATIMLILVLWRMYLVLTDINATTQITKKRAKDFDLWLSEIESSVNSFSEVLRGFVKSFQSIAKIKNKIEAFVNADKEDKASDKEPASTKNGQV